MTDVRTSQVVKDQLVGPGRANGSHRSDHVCKPTMSRDCSNSGLEKELPKKPDSREGLTGQRGNHLQKHHNVSFCKLPAASPVLHISRVTLSFGLAGNPSQTAILQARIESRYQPSAVSHLACATKSRDGSLRSRQDEHPFPLRTSKRIVCWDEHAFLLFRLAISQGSAKCKTTEL